MPYIEKVDGVKFRATALDAVLTESKNGNAMVVIAFQLLDPPHIEMAYRGMLMGKQTDRTLDTLRLCGWKGDDLSNITLDKGNEVALVLENEVYEGKNHTHIKWVNKVGGAGMAKVKDSLSPVERQALAASLAGAVLAHKQKAMAEGGVEAGTGDIPF
jgi:hypothetical protein